MRRTPHCAGCDDAIWWGLHTRLAPGHGVLRLFFHRRCQKSYNRGIGGEERSVSTLWAQSSIGDERGREVPGCLAMDDKNGG